MKQRIIIASHRRSGTHLMLDSIMNNFELFSRSKGKALVVLDHFAGAHPQPPMSLDDFRRYMEASPRVMKSHSHGHIGDFFSGDVQVRECMEQLFDDSKVIYMHRDGRDVMVSLYHYQRSWDPGLKGVSFSDYIRMPNNYDAGTFKQELNRVEYWAYHVESWRSREGCLLVSFQEIRNDYENTLGKISTFIGHPLNDCIIDVRISPEEQNAGLTGKIRRRLSGIFGGKKLTSVGFRRGVSGDWRNHFAYEDVEFFDEIAGNTNRALGYE